MPRLLQLKSIH